MPKTKEESCLSSSLVVSTFVSYILLGRVYLVHLPAAATE